MRVRALRLTLTLLAPSVAACSFFAPSYEEFASGSGKAAAGHAPIDESAGGGSSAGAAAGGGSGAAAGQGATTGSGASPSGGAGSSGEAGMTVEPEPEPAPVHSQPVAATDVELQPVFLTGIPSFAALTQYDIDEASAAAAGAQPLYQPYDSSLAGFWDNLVAEQAQARVTLVELPTRGVYTLDASDLTGPGNENPRRLSGWVEAVERARAAALFEAYCLVDTPYLLDTANSFHGTKNSQFDCAVASDWIDVVWARTIQPWFDTIPASSWYMIDGHPLIQFGALPSVGLMNAAGNLSKMLSAVTKLFIATYGTLPSFILDASWFDADPTLSTNAYVRFESPWLVPNAGSSGFSSYNGNTLGTIVPGFSRPSIARHSLDSDNHQLTTLLTGLGSAVQNGAQLVTLQGFTNLANAAGFYRSNAKDWATPNEYLGLVRRFSDPRTATLRLEAEGCDSYLDTTTGNSGGAFRRSGDLDVRALNGSGWAVTDTAPGEWLEFDGVDLSAGNYRFVASYSTRAGPTGNEGPRIELVLDGIKLAPVILSGTADTDSFSTTLLGQATVEHGAHTLQLRFLDGLVDLDWLFVEKLDRDVQLQVSGGTFLSAVLGGGGEVVTTAVSATGWERFTFDDSNGGVLADGDVVYVQARNGLYLSVGADQKITASNRQPSAAAAFTIRVQGGGGLNPGTMIALEASDDIHYWTSGANNLLDATATSIGAAQTFKYGY